MGLLSSIPRPILTTFILSILYNVSFFTQFVTIPYLLKSLGASDSANGLIQTVGGVLQIIGGPIFGHIIKTSGVRNALLLCYGSLLVSGLSLYLAQDFMVVLISRITTLFMHGQQGHQALLAALTQPGQERTNAFGRMGLTFGIGFVFTPVVCYISTKLFSESTPFLMSTILSIIPCVVLLKHIPREAYESHESGSAESNISIANSIAILKKPGVLNVLTKKNFPIVPCLLFFSIMQVYMINEFQMNAETSHLVQLVTGIYIMINNGFGIIWLRKRYEEQDLLFIGMASFSVGFFLFFFFNRLWVIFFIMPFISLGMSVVATVADSLLTALVEDEEQGLILGVSTALNSFVRTVAPAFAGYLLDSCGFAVFPLIGTICTLAGHIALRVAPLDSSLLKTKKE